MSLTSILTLAHLIGLALGVGAATVKLTLLLRCKTNHSFIPLYIAASKPITRQIVLGMIILTLSGICWLFLGYPITTMLLVKVTLVALIWVLGPIIDNVIEPKFKKLAPALGEAVSDEFRLVMKKYFALELIATALFYVIIIFWIVI